MTDINPRRAEGKDIDPPITRGSFNSMSYNAGDLGIAFSGSADLAFTIQNSLLLVVCKWAQILSKCREDLEVAKRAATKEDLDFIEKYRKPDAHISDEDSKHIQVHTTHYNDILDMFQKYGTTASGLVENVSQENTSISNSIEQFIQSLTKLISIMAGVRG